jgi:hypothetical protein
MFTLPIDIDATIKAECWTFYKTCILETTTRGRNWLATHLNAYLDGSFNVLFGDGRNMYPYDYFESALNFESVNINNIKPARIVEYIKNLLTKNNYIVVDCNLARISLSGDGRFYTHEVLIYGFDDVNKVFYSPLLDNTTGKPEILQISYDRFEASYQDIRNRYLRDPDTRFWRSYCWNYPITKIKPKKLNPCTDNLIFGCLKKLEMEFDVECREYTRYNDKNEVIHKWNHYNGIGCLLGLEHVIKITIKGEYDLTNSTPDLTLSLLRLFEHRLNIIRALELLDSLTQNCLSSKGLIETYRELSVMIQKCYLMAKKWYAYPKERLLTAILEILRKNRVAEECVLRQSFETVHQYLNLSYSNRRMRCEKN